jgi:L-aspartate oxidase
VSNHKPMISRFLVVGSGIAGLQFALLAAEHGTVNVVTKKKSSDSNTNYAQGGIAAVLSPSDDFESHVQDTLTAGDGLCRVETVRRMVEAGPRLINRLLEHGVDFSRTGDDEKADFELGREGGHSHKRILHAADLTGKELENRLLAACHANPRIMIDEDHLGLDLITDHEVDAIDSESGRVVGCWVLDRTSLQRRAFLADAVILATGGCGKVYAYTSNPDIATGDGIAMALRAGARLGNLELVQFHPTCLFHPQAKSFLISEAVRGEGAWLVTENDDRFMERYHPLRELAPRDVVARAIDQEMKRSGDASVFLDLRHMNAEHVYDRFPNLTRTCGKFGIDMAKDRVPVVPAAHYMCGGVIVDGSGRSTLPGLYAIGEVACSGVHGANRLASNSLLEAVYFAETASQAAIQEPVIFSKQGVEPQIRTEFPPAMSSGPEAVVLEHDWDLVRRVMWDYVGIVRSGHRLAIALERIRGIRLTVDSIYHASITNPDLAELRNIALVAELIIRSAGLRRESRGLHYNQDYPLKSDTPENTNLYLDADDNLQLEMVPEQV